MKGYAPTPLQIPSPPAPKTLKPFALQPPGKKLINTTILGFLPYENFCTVLFQFYFLIHFKRNIVDPYPVNRNPPIFTACFK